MQDYDLVIVGAGSGNMLPTPETENWRIAIIDRRLRRIQREVHGEPTRPARQRMHHSARTRTTHLP